MKNDTNLITPKAQSIAADILGLPSNKIEIQPVGGGYSRNRRALVGYGDEWLFVKEVDVDLLPDDGELELWWLLKDHLCMQEVRKSAPKLVPDWSQVEADNHVLLMTSYKFSDGWLWSLPIEPELQARYIQAVLDAVRELGNIKFEESMAEKLKLQPYFRDKLALDEGLQLVVENNAIKNQLKDKYVNFSNKNPLYSYIKDILILLDDENKLQELALKASELINQPNNIFNHCDVRSDNLAFNPDTGELRFVDWNWASFAPKGFGETEFLVDMARRGVDVSPWARYLNIEMLAAIVGTYFRRCLEDPLSPNCTLRNMQAESAAVAFGLYNLALLSRNK